MTRPNQARILKAIGVHLIAGLLFWSPPPVWQEVLGWVWYVAWIGTALYVLFLLFGLGLPPRTSEEPEPTTPS